MPEQTTDLADRAHIREYQVFPEGRSPAGRHMPPEPAPAAEGQSGDDGAEQPEAAKAPPPGKATSRRRTGGEA